MTESQRAVLDRVCRETAGPLLYDYVSWVLTEAEKRELHTLYFLARDGWLLREMAELLCEKWALPIRCRYLYVSRAALRLPSYHLIGEEAFALLRRSASRTTLRSFLERAAMNAGQQKQILAACGLEGEDPERLLSRGEQRALCEKLEACGCFRTLLEENSRAAYPAAVGYLRQEGLLEQERLALVDSGWTGSVQRSLRQLLASAGYRGEITGFYFGLFCSPGREDGQYLTRCFDRRGPGRDKACFNPNLFECLLSAPYGMTAGYRLEGGRYTPVLGPAPDENTRELLLAQAERVTAYTQERLEKDGPGARASLRMSAGLRRRLRRLMAGPDAEEAALFGAFLFCDDVTESYRQALAGPEQLEALKDYSLLRRLRTRLREQDGTAPALLWPCGTAAFLPNWKRNWIRWNITAWEWLRLSVKD